MPVMITVQALAEQMDKDTHTLYEWASRADDPLPLYYEPGTVRNGSINVGEFEDWWKRNRVHYRERKDYGNEEIGAA